MRTYIYLMFSLIFIFSKCHNPKNENSENKLERKITICEGSLKPKLFLNFWDGMNKGEYNCALNMMLDSSLLVRKDEKIYYILKSDSLNLKSYFQKDSLTKISLFFLGFLPVDDGNPRLDTHWADVKHINEVKMILTKKYGKPYMENYNILKYQDYEIGTFWKTEEKIINLNLYEGTLSYISIGYMNKIIAEKKLDQKRMESKNLDEIKNL